MMNDADFQAKEYASGTNVATNLNSEFEAIMVSTTVKHFVHKGVPHQFVRMTLNRFTVDNERGFRSCKEMSQALSQVQSSLYKPA